MSLWLYIKRKLMEWEVTKVTDLDLHAQVSEAMNGAVLTGPPRHAVFLTKDRPGVYETIAFAGGVQSDPQELVDFMATTLLDACERVKADGYNCMIWRVKPQIGVDPILDTNYNVLDWQYKIRCRVVWGTLTFPSLAETPAAL